MADDIRVLNRVGLPPRPLTAGDIARQRAPRPVEQARQPVDGESSPDQPEGDSPFKKSDPLPKPGDKYKPCAGLMNRVPIEPRLIHFVRKDGSFEGYSYADLRRVRWLNVTEAGKGPMMVLRFVEAEITDVTIEGRNLEEIHYWISEGRMPWVAEQPNGFKTMDDKATVITCIRFDKATPFAGSE